MYHSGQSKRPSITPGKDLKTNCSLWAKRHRRSRAQLISEWIPERRDNDILLFETVSVYHPIHMALFKFLIIDREKFKPTFIIVPYIRPSGLGVRWTIMVRWSCNSPVYKGRHSVVRPVGRSWNWKNASQVTIMWPWTHWQSDKETSSIQTLFMAPLLFIDSDVYSALGIQRHLVAIILT